MKRASILIIAVFALLAATACAQESARLKVNVPFDFMVGEKALPAGDYCVQIGWGGYHHSTVAIQTASGETLAVFLTTRLQRFVIDGTDVKPSLDFHAYGDKHFLARVWHSRVAGRAFHVSKFERELQMGGKLQAASLTLSAAR